LLGYTGITLYVPVGMLGVAFSAIPAIMWPSVAYIVDQKRLGSAYALMFILQQIGVGGLNKLVGWSNDYALAGPANPAGYLPMMWMFTVLGVLALLFAFFLWRNETGPHSHGLETIKA
jgi:Na+/melibiose symporter-like transporter